MFLILLVLSVIFFIIGIGLCRNDKFDEEIWGAVAFLSIGFMALIIIISFVIYPVPNIIEGRYINDKISVYQEENNNIESDIENIISQYQEHEKEVFDMSEINSATTLIQMYPELKSDEMVVKQIEIYNSNNKQIKRLKMKQIDCNKAKWWLYFGG